MKTLSRLWHSLTCGCHREQHQTRWTGWARVVLPLMSAAAVAWFFIRVIPKPMRATYPCQQAAFPVLSAAVVWLLGVKTAVLSVFKFRAEKVRLGLMVACVVLASGLAVWGATGAGRKNTIPKTPWVPKDGPNSPIGVAKGIFPGRVVWMRDTNATPWNCDTNSGHWWDTGTGVNQAAVDRMTSRLLQALTGARTDREAWEKIFRYHNSTRGRGDTGYRTNEIIAIKPNCNNAYAGNGDVDQQIDASSQAVLAMLRQLVNNAGVPQDKILVYEAVRFIPNRMINACRPEFPGVVWMDSKGTNGICQKVVWHENVFSYSVTESNTCGTGVPEQVYQSTYLINMALLKGHPTTGVTLTAKNHYGTVNGREHKTYINTWQHSMGIYNPFVDMIGTKELGGKTILYMIDGLFGTRDANDPVLPQFAGWTNLFGGQWSASLFMSQDPVAIDSVGLDFLRCEFSPNLGRGHDADADNYLHEAAQANKPPSGTVYQPDGKPLASLGVHEHWNNPVAKQYSRNLSKTGTGIELVPLQ